MIINPIQGTLMMVDLKTGKEIKLGEVREMKMEFGNLETPKMFDCDVTAIKLNSNETVFNQEMLGRLLGFDFRNKSNNWLRIHGLPARRGVSNKKNKIHRYFHRFLKSEVCLNDSIRKRD